MVDAQIKNINQDVVADAFRYGKEDQVVVTTPDDVYLEKRTITVRGGKPNKSQSMGAPGTAPLATSAASKTPSKK